ncbi:hypothetical protein E1265_19270 [Streptomyces sp. 8K308]|uniref:hypothetical protein n=1 Tax=Streptomyces sp. 8K308 TaxID=2530388 RepID=UPI001046DF5F|nr:hypothetical protein E1265_19270 [Streptomyces sp. 8K308]
MVAARYEHINRAAKEPRIAPPSLSRTIALPEAEFDSPAVDRQEHHGRLAREDHREDAHRQHRLGHCELPLSKDGSAD